MTKRDILNTPLNTNDVLPLLAQKAKIDENTGMIRRRICTTEENIRTILTRDARLCDAIHYDAFADRILWFDDELTKHDIQDLRFWLADHYQMRTSQGNLVNAEMLEDVLMWYARRRQLDPLKSYLKSLEWDKKPRLRTMLSRLFGVASSPLVEEISYRWAISCVARGMVAGAKVDTVLCLVGKQGAGKSQGFQALAGSTWFSDSHLDIRNKEAYVSIHNSGVWIWELAELQSVRQRDAETVKMFLSAQQDRYRPLYESRPITRGRRTVFVATTNEYAFLHDSENRRFWPVEVGEIDLDGIKAEREQLWAEAVAAYEAGEHWWLVDTDEEKYTANLNDHQQQFANDDAWFNAVRRSLCDESAGEGGATIEECLDALEIPNAQRGKSATMRVAKILVKLGAKKKRVRSIRNGTYGYWSVWSLK